MTTFYDPASDSAVGRPFRKIPVCINSEDRAMLGSNLSAEIDDRSMGAV